MGLSSISGRETPTVEFLELKLKPVLQELHLKERKGKQFYLGSWNSLWRKGEGLGYSLPFLGPSILLSQTGH